MTANNSPDRLISLSRIAWQHWDNLAARLCMPVADVLEGVAGRGDLLDAIAAALAEPVGAIHESPLPYRLAPSHPITTQIAEITVCGEAIWVHSDWNQTLIDTVKPLGYRCDEHNGIWYRQINKLRAPLTDRLVELGVHLLAAGLIIQVPTMALANRITVADYQPERKRWVAVSNLDRYAGWFFVFWPHEERHGEAVKRLTGARLFRSSAVIPAASFDEVLDFADRHGFAVSDKALDLAAQAEADRSALLISDPQPPRITHHASPPLAPFPVPPAPSAIPHELADDPL